MDAISLTPLKKHVADLAALLNEDHDSAEDAARAVLEAAWQMYEERAKYTVVGQVKSGDRKGDKIALGWYSTAGQAKAEGLKLAYSAQTHEEHWTWVLPVWHGTPHSYYAKRKHDLKLEALADLTFRERELQRRIEWCNQHPGEPTPEEWGALLYESQTVQCDHCDGVGRIKKEVAA